MGQTTEKFDDRRLIHPVNTRGAVLYKEGTIFVPNICQWLGFIITGFSWLPIKPKSVVQDEVKGAGKFRGSVRRVVVPFIIDQEEILAPPTDGLLSNRGHLGELA